MLLISNVVIKILTLLRWSLHYFKTFISPTTPIGTFEKFKQIAPDQVIVVGGGGKSPKIQVDFDFWKKYSQNWF